MAQYSKMNTETRLRWGPDTLQYSQNTSHHFHGLMKPRTGGRADGREELKASPSEDKAKVLPSLLTESERQWSLLIKAFKHMR